jgi:hypothetical protein
LSNRCKTDKASQQSGQPSVACALLFVLLVPRRWLRIFIRPYAFVCTCALALDGVQNRPSGATTNMQSGGHPMLTPYVFSDYSTLLEFTLVERMCNFFSSDGNTFYVVLARWPHPMLIPYVCFEYAALSLISLLERMCNLFSSTLSYCRLLDVCPSTRASPYRFSIV